MLLNEFKINEHITLRLEDGLTNIYVGEHHFNHCKYLLLNIPIEDLYLYDDIESVDDAVMIYDRKMEGLQEEGIEELPPEEEFWGIAQIYRHGESVNIILEFSIVTSPFLY